MKSISRTTIDYLRRSFVKSAFVEGDIWKGRDDCVNFTKHITAATEARSLYRKQKEREWTEHEVAISVDMQKVIILPKLPGLKQAIFCKRLVLFNGTFWPVRGWKKSKPLKPTGVLRDDAIKGRSAEDVANAFIHFVSKNCDIQSFIFWAEIALLKTKTGSFSLH